MFPKTARSAPESRLFCASFNGITPEIRSSSCNDTYPTKDTKQPIRPPIVKMTTIEELLDAFFDIKVSLLPLYIYDMKLMSIKPVPTARRSPEPIKHTSMTCESIDVNTRFIDRLPSPAPVEQGQVCRLFDLLFIT